MKEFFSTDSYDTPPTTSRFTMDRLFMGSRWWFHFLFVKTLLKYRKMAIQGKYSDEMWAQSSYEILKIVEGCGGRIHLRGLNNINKISDPLVFVSNHMSTLETMIFPAMIATRKKFTFIVKASLVKNFIFGPIMRSRSPILVNRKDPGEDLMTVMSEGCNKLNNGISVLLFPQSTRAEGFNEESFNSLGVKLARKAGVKILPVAIKTDYWGNSRVWKEFGPIRRDRDIYISFGEPMEISGRGLEEHRRTVDFIRSEFQSWESSQHS